MHISNAISPTASLEYLDRIHFPVPTDLNSLGSSLQTLQALHMAHLLAVPFENLSIHYEQPIMLQEDALFNKIVRRRRGGFCYELNGLFAWLLGQLGFNVTLLSAEVANDAGAFSPPFDHLTLLVRRVDGADWLADVGFGDSFLLPIRFEVEVVQVDADGRNYRLLKEEAEDEADTKREYWILQQLSGEQWKSQYRFTLEPHLLTDFTERCHYQQHSPESHFAQRRVCTLATSTGRITLSARGLRFNDTRSQSVLHGQTGQEEGNLHLITTVHGHKQVRLLHSEDEYQKVLAEMFGVVL